MGFRFLVVEGRGYVAVGWMRGELFCRREEEANWGKSMLVEIYGAHFSLPTKLLVLESIEEH